MIAFSRIRPDPKRPTDMVEDDDCVGKGAREINKLRKLWMIEPGIEAQAVALQTGKTAAKGTVRQQTRRRVAANLLTRIPGRRMPDAAEAIRACRHVRFQHLRNRVSQPEIRMPHDARCH